MLTALLWFNALLGITLAAVLLRAGVSRTQNRTLAQAALLDAAVSAGLAVIAQGGANIVSPYAIRLYLVGRLLIIGPLLRFLHAFPTQRAPSTVSRLLEWSSVVLAILLVVLPCPFDGLDERFLRPILIPVGLIGFYVLHQAQLPLQVGSTLNDYRVVTRALVLRWIAELLAYQVVLPLWPSLFPVVFALNATVLSLVSFMIMIPVVLRHRSFQVSGLLAETVLLVALALFTIGMTVFALDLIAHGIVKPVARGLGFALAASLPCVVLVAMQRYASALEAALPQRLSSRRWLARSLLQRLTSDAVQLAEAEEFCRLVLGSLSELSGGDVTFRPVVAQGKPGWFHARAAAPLPVSFERYWQAGGEDVISIEQALPTAREWTGLAADMLVVVRAHGELCGALAFRGGTLDAHTVELARRLAELLGVKLAHQALCTRAFELVGQLESSRHLATLGSFVAAIAHDIRTPLTSVRLNLQMVSSEVTTSSVQPCMSLALRELDRMGDYVRGLLDYVKPVQLRIVEISVSELLGEVALLVRPLLDSRNQHLVRTLDVCTATVLLRVDALRMRQVLASLIENASDASASGATIWLRVRVTVAGQLAVCIADQGGGIREADLERLFEPFFTTRCEGTGLGLAIARRVVDAHGGSIDVRSKPQLGSAFTVTVPLARSVLRDSHKT